MKPAAPVTSARMKIPPRVRYKRSAASRESVMTEYILTLNAGSSSIKFALFAAGRCNRTAAARSSAWAARRNCVIAPRRRRPRPHALPRGRARPPRRARCRARRLARGDAGSRVVAVGHRIVHGGAEYRPRPHRRRGLCGARKRWSRSRPCTSRTTSPASTPPAPCFRTPRRSPVSTPPSIAATISSTTPTPCRANSTTRACAATAFTASPTNMSARGCARSTAKPPPAASSSLISATAPPCAR